MLEKGSSEESFRRSFISTLHERDSTEEYLGAFTGIGSRNKLPLVQLKNSWKFRSTYTSVGSRNKLPLVQLRDSEEILGRIFNPVLHKKGPAEKTQY